MQISSEQTQQMALEVEREAFLSKSGDLGRSPDQSPDAVGQGSIFITQPDVTSHPFYCVCDLCSLYL